MFLELQRSWLPMTVEEFFLAPSLFSDSTKRHTKIEQLALYARRYISSICRYITNGWQRVAKFGVISTGRWEIAQCLIHHTATDFINWCYDFRCHWTTHPMDVWPSCLCLIYCWATLQETYVKLQQLGFGPIDWEKLWTFRITFTFKWSCRFSEIVYVRWCFVAIWGLHVNEHLRGDTALRKWTFVEFGDLEFKAYVCGNEPSCNCYERKTWGFWNNPKHTVGRKEMKQRRGFIILT